MNSEYHCVLIIKTFHVANLVIQDTLERIYINQSTFGEAYRGVFIVRGENVVYVGELDEAREEQEDSLVVDSPTANANIEPFPRFSPGTLLAERQQVRLKQQQQIERNAETGKPVIRRIPFEDAQKIHASVAQSTLEAHIKQTSTLPNEKFTDTLELAYY